MKKNSKSYGGNVYGQKKLIKTLINVLPIVIVPLVTERKRIKEHPDVQKVTNATSKATSKQLLQFQIKLQMSKST